jgi:ribose 5-phosphate isomerase A
MNDKERAALYAVQRVEPGMSVGLGTGSTANAFVRALAVRVQAGLSVQVVASSLATARLARELGLSLQSVEYTESLDLYVDGADEVNPQRVLLKGRGYDLVREKILARASARFLVLIESSKRVDAIGSLYPVPVEVLPFAWLSVQAQLRKLNARVRLRLNASQDGPALTSQGNLVLEANFSPDVDVAVLDSALSSIPGVAEHGIFLDRAHSIIEASGGEVREW